jgi:deazaflavin-dependent oxidoreductase (nitroreductase family)
MNRMGTDTSGGSRKQRLLRPVEMYLVNPIMRALLRRGVAPRAFALLETTGRRTGKQRLTPVGNGLDGDTIWIVAEHGQRCAYVQNLIANPRVRVKVGREWRAGTAALVPNDNGIERRHALDRRNGLVGRLDGIAFRASATDVCTVRIDLD